MADVVPPPTPCGLLTTTSSSDVRITDKTNMHLPNFLPTAVSFPTQTEKQDTPPSLSAVTTLQVGQSVTHIESDGTWVPTITKKVMI